ncbi:MAG: DNA polymerase I [Treponema sp.]
MADFDDKTVYVLDAYGLIFRCYFAFVNRPLTNSEGKNISALFAFFRNLHAVFEHYKPSLFVAAFDSKTPTFRHKMYADYKATRNKTPEDLHAQIPWIEETLAALGVPVLQCDGYEADDLIATLAKKCAAAGRPCRILSADKDLMQLVGKSVQILKPDSSDVWKVTGEEGVIAEWGVKPAQLLDLLSLYGDASDNIPGVKGIGIKTADKLLNEYGDLDGIYAHIDEIKGAVQTKLINGKENAYFSRDLVRLCSDVPCNQIDELLAGGAIALDYAAAAEKLKRFEARSAAAQYESLAAGAQSAMEGTPPENGDAAPSPPPVKNKGNYRALLTLPELETFINGILNSEEKTAAFDCETDSLDTFTARLVGFSLCCKAGEAVYVPLYAASMFENSNFIPQEAALSQLERIFNDERASIILHNGKFDLKTLISSGIRFTDSQPACTLIDTMIAAWMLSPDRTGRSAYSLEYLSETKLALSGTEYRDIVPKGQTFADVPLETAVNYAAEDADFTFRLWQKFKPELEQSNLYELFTQTEMRIMPVLTRMEIAGIHLNSGILHEYDTELAAGIAAAEAEIYRTVGHEFNIASPKQLQEVLFTERGLKPGKKTKTGYSTDTSVLEDLSLYDPVPKMILEHRELSKLESTYVQTLPALCDKAGRIHPDFIQTGTATGRLSCRDPNLQNIPVKTEAGRRIRSAFTAAEETVLISADYSQIELAVFAHLSGDENMRRAFIEGTDIHKASAALLFGTDTQSVTPDMRRTAKTINFGVIYGMSAFRLANALGISRTDAAKFIENYFKTYSAIKIFMEETVRAAEERGYVETLFGRRRAIMNINSRNKVEKAAAERVAVNTPVQGSAADIVKKAMLDVDCALRKKNNGARIILQVHDELLLECPEDDSILTETLALVKDKMEHAVVLSVPLRVSIEHGKNWGQFH